MQKIILSAFIFFSFFGYGQRKNLETKFNSLPIEIDGIQAESAWQTAEIAKDFVMFQPDNGKAVSENQKSEVKVLYDNNAVYISALLYDDGKVLTENTQRDNTGASDFFGVLINGYDDGQGDFRFFVTAANTQLDCSATEGTGEDFSWDAVWESKAVLTEFGWSLEMKIPYAALRFSNQKKQTWGLQFFRMIKRDNHKYTWNFVDLKQGNFGGQFGVLNGVENIKPPTRLFLMPYVSHYTNANAFEKSKGILKGGLDIKYGINDAFTLDVILIPDFGQTALDQKILNLGPFEQQFNENRPFFTEGTDLFSKGNLVYSRRIGGYPSINPEYDSNTEKIIESPASSSLINAFKISGRTKGGLGIGILNAITETTLETIQNKNTGETRREIVEPLANYNVLVLDQRFRSNSSVSFVNTNVTRDGSYRDANVSALVWDLKNKSNTYQLLGDFKYSIINEGNVIENNSLLFPFLNNYVFNKDGKEGVKAGLEFNKIGGKWRAGIGGDLYTKDFDPNDLGINFQTNFFDLYGNVSYRILKATKKLNSFSVGFYPYTEFEKTTGKNMVNAFNLNMNLTTINNHSYGFGINTNPFQSYNFYEPRVEGRYSIFPTRIAFWTYISTNYNKKFAFDFNPSIGFLGEENRINYAFNLGPRYRFNNKFSLEYNFNFFRQNNYKGFVDLGDFDANPLTPNDIIYANRTVVTYSNSLSGKYSVNSKMNFNLRVFHYWSYAQSHNFYTLQNDGSLQDINSITGNYNSSYYNWNYDLSYNYWFAPGSQVSVLYRNYASTFEQDINKNLDQTITGLFRNDKLSQTLSISIRYFIDYNKAKNWF